MHHWRVLRHGAWIIPSLVVGSQFLPGDSPQILNRNQSKARSKQKVLASDIDPKIVKSEHLLTLLPLVDDKNAYSFLEEIEQRMHNPKEKENILSRGASRSLLWVSLTHSGISASKFHKKHQVVETRSPSSTVKRSKSEVEKRWKAIRSKLTSSDEIKHPNSNILQEISQLDQFANESPLEALSSSENTVQEELILSEEDIAKMKERHKELLAEFIESDLHHQERMIEFEIFEKSLHMLDGLLPDGRIANEILDYGGYPLLYRLLRMTNPPQNVLFTFQNAANKNIKAATEEDLYSLLSQVINPSEMSPLLSYHLLQASKAFEQRNTPEFNENYEGMVFVSPQKYRNQILGHSLMSLVYSTATDSLARARFVQEGGIQILQSVYASADVEMRGIIMRIMSNIAIEEQFHDSIGQSELLQEAHQLCRMQAKSVHELLSQSYAARLLFNLDESVKLGDSVHLVYPQTTNPDPPLVDIVFIHGLSGCPYGTWRCEGTEDENATSWHRDWLSNDVPIARIFTVSYSTVMSTWHRDDVHLQERSQEILNDLKQCGVGQRPTIFIVHSMGGLIVKSMVSQEYINQKDDFLRNIKGVVFYGTPHFGSRLVEYFQGVDSIFRLSPTVRDLLYNSQHLHDLNQVYQKVDHIRTISFGELLETNITGTSPAVSFMIVPTESSNPNVGTHFQVQLDHMNICKPMKKSDLQYSAVINLVDQIMEENIRMHTLEHSPHLRERS